MFKKLKIQIRSNSEKTYKHTSQNCVCFSIIITTESGTLLVFKMANMKCTKICNRQKEIRGSKLFFDVTQKMMNNQIYNSWHDTRIKWILN